MRPRRNPDIETKLLPDGHAVLFSNQNNWAHTITPLAAVAWEFCDGNHTECDISSRIAEIAPPESIGADLENIVKELIQQFEDSGLLISEGVTDAQPS